MRSLKVNLSIAIPSMFFGWSLTWVFTTVVYEDIPIFTLFLMSSLIFQGLFARCTFAFSDDIQIYSEELANNSIPLYLQSKVGSLLTVVCIVFSKYVIALFILLATLVFSDQLYNINSATILCLVVMMGLLLDPILAFILRIDESPNAEIMTALAGYLALLLISVGAIPLEDKCDYALLTFNILATRMAFMTTFAFDKREGILVFAPSIVALFIAVYPNLGLLLPELR
jgi:hypothetical protein